MFNPSRFADHGRHVQRERQRACGECAPPARVGGGGVDREENEGTDRLDVAEPLGQPRAGGAQRDE
jgi:hypothetical protein